MGESMVFRNVWTDDSAQDIAEYAVMLAVVLVVTLVAIRAIGINAGTVYSRLASVLDSVK
jgi:Flp pilus assembly pilin Flp